MAVRIKQQQFTKQYLDSMQEEECNPVLTLVVKNDNVENIGNLWEQQFSKAQSAHKQWHSKINAKQLSDSGLQSLVQSVCMLQYPIFSFVESEHVAPKSNQCRIHC